MSIWSRDWRDDAVCGVPRRQFAHLGADLGGGRDQGARVSARRQLDSRVVEIGFAASPPVGSSRMMEIFLKRFDGVIFHSARSAEIGIEIAKIVRPDLVLMDINLPGMNGFSALKALRADPGTRNIPVIAASANAMPEDIQNGEGAGFDGYITKPFHIQDIVSAMSRELRRQPISAGLKADVNGDIS